MQNKVPIGDIVELSQGFAINKKTNHHISDRPTELKLLRIGDMKSGDFSVFVRNTIPEKFIACDKDIIYTRTGQVGLVFRGYNGVIHNNCFSVIPKDEPEAVLVHINAFQIPKQPIGSLPHRQIQRRRGSYQGRKEPAPRDGTAQIIAY